MTDDNRIHVRMDPELVPVPVEDRRLDVKAEIQVNVQSRLTGLGVVGVVALALGAVAVVAASLLFATGYPDKYHALAGYTLAKSHAFIETVALVGALGLVLLLWGASAFFYGRNVLGAGRLDSFDRLTPVEDA